MYLHHLYQNCYTHAASGAQCCDSVLLLSSLQLVDQRNHQSCAGSAYRMSDGDSAAVDVELIDVDTQISLASETLCSERFVHFPQINIFYCKTPAEITEWGGYEFRSNCYYNLTPKAEESDAVVADPGFTAGGTGAVGRDTLKGYTLKAESPCKEKGIVIPDNGGIDFFGDPIGEKPSIGAVQ